MGPEGTPTDFRKVYYGREYINLIFLVRRDPEIPPLQTRMQCGCTRHDSGLRCISVLNHQKLRWPTSWGVGRYEGERMSESGRGGGKDVRP